MACERYRDALRDAAAGAPTPAAVGTHLATCEGCRADLEALRQALAAADAELAGLAAAEPSPELAVRIRRAVADSGPSPAWRFGWLWPVTAAAATLLVALAVWVGRPPVIPRDSRLPLDGGEASSVAARSETPRGSAIAAGPAAAPAGDGLSSRGAPGVSGAEGSAVPPVETAATRAEVRRAGGSLGTPRAGVPRDDRGPRDDTTVPRDDRPEVLVPPGEEEALLCLVALVHRDRLSLAGLSAAGPPTPDLAGPQPLDIPPLEIVPLDRAESPGT